MLPKTRQLLRHVGVRQRVRSFGGRFHLFFLVFAALYAVLLLVSRYLGLIADRWFVPTELAGALALAGVPVAAGVAATLLMRRPDLSATAHLVDRRLETKDLFLTVSRMESATGEFGPLVLASAESRSIGVRPKSVVAFHWPGRARDIALAALVLVAAALWLPAYNLLEDREATARLNARRRQLAESREATAKRAAALRQRDVETRHSREVDLALTDLRQTFNTMKPEAKNENARRLTQKQLEVNELWKQLCRQRLEDALGRSSPGQRFGSRSLEKQKAWKEDLDKGDPSSLKKELAEIEQAARRLEQLTKESEKAELRRQITERLKDLADFAEKDLNSRACSNALTQALDQLGLSADSKLSKEALEALRESLNLTEQEIARLAQNLRDLKGLEDARKALQLARRCNSRGEGLDGTECEGRGGIDEYAELYRQLLAEGDGQGDQPGEGGGMKGPGVGEGGKAPEDPEAETDFVSEQSRSAMTAGEILLKWKTQGLSTPGEAKIDYRTRIEEVKSGVSEAILREQIPPGYHEAIRKYFDTMRAETREPEKK